MVADLPCEDRLACTLFPALNGKPPIHAACQFSQWTLNIPTDPSVLDGQIFRLRNLNLNSVKRSYRIWLKFLEATNK